MALFEKFFPTRKKVDKKERNTREHAKPFRFSADQVRVLLYRECEFRGRRLLYDSAAVEKVALGDALKTPQSSFKRFYHQKKENKNEKGPEQKTFKDKIVEVSEGYGFQCNMPNADSNIVGEMIFGSVAMNYKGMSLKVHILNAPQRLMFTKVFHVPSRGRCGMRGGGRASARTSISSGISHGDVCPQDSSVGLTNINGNGSSLSAYGESVISGSCSKTGASSPSDLPAFNADDHLSANWSMNKEDSGCYGDFSSHSSVSSSCNYDWICSVRDGDDAGDNIEDVYFFGNPSDLLQPNSNSLQWRLNRHLSTSLEKSSTSSSTNAGSDSSGIPGASDSQLSSGSAASAVSESLASSVGGGSSQLRKTKMGLAIIITLSESAESHMMRFLMEHALFVEGALSRLHLSVRSACKDPHSFYSSMAAATQDAGNWLVDMMTGPRLRAPVWLTLAGSQKHNTDNKMAELFLKDLCLLLKSMDTKDTHFFMSTLITSVLTHHLGWVSYVSPYTTTLSTMRQKEPDSLNQGHPYNPLWAQLGELYGAIGTPAKISRTVIFGRHDSILIKRILRVLSYFIRCSEVNRFAVDSGPLSFESMETWLKNHQFESASPVSANDQAKCSSPENGDYIEMSTFSIKQKSVASRPESVERDLDFQYPLKFKTKNAEKKLQESVEYDNVSNCFLKRTKSCAFNLPDVTNKHFDSVLNSSESSLSSASTLKPTESGNESTDTLVFNNKFNIGTGSISNDSIDCDEIHTKINRLCRVPTTTLLCQTESDSFIDDVSSSEGPISYNNNDGISKFEIDPVPYSRMECEKQTKSSCKFMTTFDVGNPSFTDDSVKNKQSKNVIFVLGEDEALVGLQTKYSKKHLQKSKSESREPISMIQEEPSLSSISIDSGFVNSKDPPLESADGTVPESVTDGSLLSSSCCIEKPQCKHSKLKKHSGVKFEFDKYPQIVTNYMKSKNLEILDRHVIGKPGNLKIDGFEMEPGTSVVAVESDCDACVGCTFNAQSLQTPSNASELEYTSDMPGQGEIQYAKEKSVPPSADPPVDRSPKIYIRRKLPKTLIINNNVEEPPKLLPHGDSLQRNPPVISPPECAKMSVDIEEIELPMAATSLIPEDESAPSPGYLNSLLGDVNDHYIPDLVLQGTVCATRDWEWKVKRDIVLQGKNAPGGAACLLADIDEWSVGIWSRGGGSVCGMSTLVASMLESLPHMCNARLPASECLAFIECKLRELCIRSKTLSELLLETDFCDMEYLTKTLHLDPNDVPLLLAIASTHSPQVTLRYGVSFR